MKTARFLFETFSDPSKGHRRSEWQNREIEFTAGESFYVGNDWFKVEYIGKEVQVSYKGEFKKDTETVLSNPLRVKLGESFYMAGSPIIKATLKSIETNSTSSGKEEEILDRVTNILKTLGGFGMYKEDNIDNTARLVSGTIEIQDFESSPYKFWEEFCNSGGSKNILTLGDWWFDTESTLDFIAKSIELDIKIEKWKNNSGSIEVTFLTENKKYNYILNAPTIDQKEKIRNYLGMQLINHLLEKMGCPYRMVALFDPQNAEDFCTYGLVESSSEGPLLRKLEKHIKIVQPNLEFTIHKL